MTGLQIFYWILGIIFIILGISCELEKLRTVRGGTLVTARIIKCEKEGYETTYNDYEIKKIYKNETLLRLNKPFVIKRITKSQKLKEVTVKATKIKFYNRGDTLIYNADAFELEEGSMLDALVQQLPDVELKKGGEIYVRGKRVDELLLNGRDFFNKDRNIILENLPSYMVNQVKVYEREDEILKKSNPDNSKLLSMNIQLKRKCPGCDYSN